MPIRINSIEMASLRRRGFCTIADVLIDRGGSFNLLKRVARTEVVATLEELSIIYAGGQLQDDPDAIYIMDSTTLQWHRPEQISTHQIRLLLNKEELITEPKLMTLTEEGALKLYCQIARLRNVANKTKLLRFLHGDVYCKERLYRFNMTDDSICGRCFGVETIQHLLIQCPYAVVSGRCS